MPIRTKIQVEDIDEELRYSLWNVFIDSLYNKVSGITWDYSRTERGEICYRVWKDFLNKPVDLIPMNGFQENLTGEVVFREIKNWFFEAFWYEVYDFLEFVLKICPQVIKESFIAELNRILEKCMSAYRVFNDNIIPVTLKSEMNVIKEALDPADHWAIATEHLNRSLSLLTDRQSPDFRNSIKESISAVEAACRNITGNSKVTLGKALLILEQKYNLHSSLKQGFSALYGYTSDAGGIRHSLTMGDSKIQFEDAKYMLVICSAFINYLKVKIHLR